MSVGKRFFFYPVLFLLSLVLILPCAALTIQEEEEIAKEFLKYIRATHRLVRDPVIVDMVRDVGETIVSELDAPPFDFTFDVVLDRTYNAFAGPGGHIYVHSGLLMAMESERELAGILGHEIAHVTCRHISQMVDRSKTIGLGTLAGLTAGILAGISGASPDAVAGLIMGTQAAGKSAILAYTRENERQADERGLGYLVATGYGGEGLLTMLKTIRGQEWFTTDEVPTYLRTHPGTDERIAFVASWLETRAATVEKIGEKDPTDEKRFLRAKARLVALYGDLETVIPQLRRAVSEKPENMALRHAFSLALIRDGKAEESLQELEKVFKADPLDPVIIADLGRVRYRAGKLEGAVSLLETAAPELEDPEVWFDLGRTYAGLKRYDEAVAVFRKVADISPALIGAWHAAGDAYGRMGKKGFAHYHLGRYSQSVRKFENAAFHYRKAVALLPEEEALREDAQKRLSVIQRQMQKQARKKK